MAEKIKKPAKKPGHLVSSTRDKTQANHEAETPDVFEQIKHMFTPGTYMINVQ